MIQVLLDIDDLMVSVEALRESVGTRLSWILRGTTPPDLEWEIVRSHIFWLTNAHLNMRNHLEPIIRHLDSGREWLDKYKIPDEVMEVLDKVILSKDGSEFSYHQPHPVLECDICAFLFEVG